MSANGHPSFEDQIDGLRDTIRKIEVQHQKAGDDAAAAEADYRRQLATAYKRHRSEGKAQDEAGILARADVIQAGEARDASAYYVRHLSEVLEDRRGERASLHRLMDRAVGS